MKAIFSTWPCRQLTRVAALSVLLSITAGLSACGGSGGSGGGSGNGASGGSTQTVTQVGPVTVAGVAAIGAPLLGATITVIDANGVTQGSNTTNTADGSYQVALNSTKIPLPLLIEASGIDMSGVPVTLHSVVQTASADSTRLTANINQITEAIVGMLLGADPLTQFHQAATKASTWTLLGNTTALSSASDMVKTIIRTNILDVKITDTSKVDFFQDLSFSANKTGVDGVLEGLQVQIGKDRAGRDQVEISNRLLAPGNPEVTINLSSAKTLLALGSTGNVANAITSTAKTTTSSAGMMNYISSLDSLVSTVNRAIADQAAGVTIAALPIFATNYASYDGLDKNSLAAKFEQYGQSGHQLSRFQFTGCADDPIPTKGCTKPKVSALVSDSTGQVVEIFSNVVTYLTTSGWTFRGNDHQNAWGIVPSAWTNWDSTGTAVSTSQGVLFEVKPIADTLYASLLLPSVHSIPLADCGLGYWCLSATPTGEIISDRGLQAGTLGWFGQQDSTRGARYKLSTQSLLGVDLTSQLLANDVPDSTAASAFPMTDGLSASTPLTCTNIVAGLHITWDAWAAANPQLRMLSVQSLVTGGATPQIQSATLYPLAANSTNVPAVSSPPASPTSCQLWLTAQDKLGRRFMSKITAAP